MKSDDIKLKLDEIGEQLKPLLFLQNRLKRDLAKALSIEFIKVNCLTKDVVQSSNGNDIPWFGYVGTFADWLRSNSTLTWCEWNGTLYRTIDILSGRMPVDAPGKYDDLI